MRQPPKNLAIDQTKSPEQPHKVLSKNLNRVVVQWVVQVEGRLHRRRRLHPLGRHDPAVSLHINIDLSSTNCAQVSTYYTTNVPCDNIYCMWLRSLIFKTV
jgi:hypothetical protein